MLHIYYYNQEGNNSKKECEFQASTNQQLSKINETLKIPIVQISELKNDVSTLRGELTKVGNENCQLKQIIKVGIYKADALEQYGCKENLQIHGILESADNSDGEKIAFQIVKILIIKLNVFDVQKAHHIGKEWRNKLRPVFMRFVNYKKINQFMFQKSKL